jgi:hypothetical protein
MRRSRRPSVIVQIAGKRRLWAIRISLILTF